MYVYKNVIFIITFFCIQSFFVVDGEDDFKTRKWKKNARCDRNACNCREGCGYPTQCRRTKGFFSKFRCRGCARLGQPCKYTHCCNSCCNGDTCVIKEDVVANVTVKCLTLGEECIMQQPIGCSECKKLPDADNCCYPMKCKSIKGINVCTGTSGEGQQCVSTGCNPGLTCSEYLQCKS
eukprot:UN02076